MVLKYPAAKWDPLGPQTEPLMRSHDILCFHTMVGSLAGTSSMFHDNGYGGTESTFGVGANMSEGVRQWQDAMRQADANLEGNHRVTSIETADYGGEFGKWNTNDASKVPAWTDDQLDMLVDLTVWWCKKETHKDCPATWDCHKVGIPCSIIEDTKPGRRGIGYHRQGCKPNVVKGGEVWSSAYGKICPGSKRENQLRAIVVPRARKILAGGSTDVPSDDKDWFDMATPEQIEEAVYQGTLRAHRQYGKEFFTDKSGTGDAIRDDIRSIKQSSDALVENTKPKG